MRKQDVARFHTDGDGLHFPRADGATQVSEQIAEPPKQRLLWWLGFVLTVAGLNYGTSILERLPWSFALNLSLYLCCAIVLVTLLAVTERRQAKPPETIHEDRITALVCAVIVGLFFGLLMLISFLLDSTVELLSADSAFRAGIFLGPVIAGWALARLIKAQWPRMSVEPGCRRS
jgi:hypothetical protein